jgi:hypothetical protein
MNAPPSRPSAILLIKTFQRTNVLFLEMPLDSLILDAAHLPFGIRIDVLAHGAPCIVAIPGSRVRNSFVFCLFSFFIPLIILRAFLIVLTATVGVSARIPGLTGRAGRPLRSRWSCYRRSRCSGAPSNK